jgi:membrane protease YdiL (CAAX protease family)
MEAAKGRGLILGLAILAEGGLGAIALAVGAWLGHPPLGSFGWDVRDAVLGAVAAAPMLLVFLLCVYRPVGPLKGLNRVAVELVKPLFAPCTLADLAFISLLAGVGEEMLFRGVLQAAFGEWLGPWPGLVAASLVFGALHLISPAYGLFATLTGVYLGWVWMLSDNLLVVMVAHALYDLVALVVLVRGPYS